MKQIRSADKAASRRKEREKMSSDRELEKFFDGSSDRAYRLFGCHPDGTGFRFRVYAPHAVSVRLLGSFNGWDRGTAPMERLGNGIWQAWENAAPGDSYRYYIECADGRFLYKNDPYAFSVSPLPAADSKVCSLGGYRWRDGDYLARRARRDPLKSPINIYELHVGSWRRREDGGLLTYRELADRLIPYLSDMGYTHVELLPITEHPLEGSWGYQVTGYYAPTARWGSPEELMELIDRCHAAGIGVILDWVGAHFPRDGCGLFEFDGECLYEPSDPLRRDHPEWGTRLFDYGKNEVRSFLISNACFWLREYHADGLRVDAVTSMLYHDYGRREGEWRPNRDGGNLNREAISFLRELNRAAFGAAPGILMAAEESTTFPMVTKPGYDGGLGFNLKWNMGWMHDLLDYVSAGEEERRRMGDRLTFSMTYAYSENFILPLSHDEVVHGKRSLIGRMPGGYEERFAGLRALLGYMIAHPGKKLSFMGNELGQFSEWSEGRELDWMLLSYDSHRKLRHYVRALNRLYRESPPLWENDADWGGFQWISTAHRENGILPFRRIDDDGGELICLFNLSFRGREDFRIGLPRRGRLQCLLSSDHPAFGGEGRTRERAMIEAIPLDGMPCSAALPLPPLSAVFYRILDRPAGKKRRGRKKQGI